MGAITEALYDRLAGDATLTALLATYGGNPAIFTTDPAPGDAELPYLVSAGEVSHGPYDTKTNEGREIRRDVRCYAAVSGSAVTIETMAERVRALLHRYQLSIEGYDVWVADCAGPIVADEENAYGRVVTVRVIMTAAEDGS